MNAAAKAIHQSTLFSGRLADLTFSRDFMLIITVSLALFMSALAVIYTTNTWRLRVNYLSQLETQSNQLTVQWGQLLLEQASLASPSRVERFAEEHLKMHQPSDREILFLQST